MQILHTVLILVLYAPELVHLQSGTSVPERVPDLPSTDSVSRTIYLDPRRVIPTVAVQTGSPTPIPVRVAPYREGRLRDPSVGIPPRYDRYVRRYRPSTRRRPYPRYDDMLRSRYRERRRLPPRSRVRGSSGRYRMRRRYRRTPAHERYDPYATYDPSDPYAHERPYTPSRRSSPGEYYRPRETDDRRSPRREVTREPPRLDRYAPRGADYRRPPPIDGRGEPRLDRYAPRGADPRRPPPTDGAREPPSDRYGPRDADYRIPPPRDATREPLRDRYAPRDMDYRRPPPRDPTREPLRDRYAPRDMDYRRPPPRDGVREPPIGRYRPRDADYRRPPPRDGGGEARRDRYVPRYADYRRPPLRDGVREPPIDRYGPRDIDYRRPPRRDVGRAPPIRSPVLRDRDNRRTQSRDRARDPPLERYLPRDYAPSSEGRAASRDTYSARDSSEYRDTRPRSVGPRDTYVAPSSSGGIRRDYSDSVVDRSADYYEPGPSDTGTNDVVATDSVSRTIHLDPRRVIPTIAVQTGLPTPDPAVPTATEFVELPVRDVYRSSNISEQKVRSADQYRPDLGTGSSVDPSRGGGFKSIDRPGPTNGRISFNTRNKIVQSVDQYSPTSEVSKSSTETKTGIGSRIPITAERSRSAISAVKSVSTSVSIGIADRFINSISSSTGDEMLVKPLNSANLKRAEISPHISDIGIKKSPLGKTLQSKTILTPASGRRSNIIVSLVKPENKTSSQRKVRKIGVTNSFPQKISVIQNIIPLVKNVSTSSGMSYVDLSPSNINQNTNIPGEIITMVRNAAPQNVKALSGPYVTTIVSNQSIAPKQSNMNQKSRSHKPAYEVHLSDRVSPSIVAIQAKTSSASDEKRFGITSAPLLRNDPTQPKISIVKLESVSLSNTTHSINRPPADRMRTDMPPSRRRRPVPELSSRHGPQIRSDTFLKSPIKDVPLTRPIDGPSGGLAPSERRPFVDEPLPRSAQTLQDRPHIELPLRSRVPPIDDPPPERRYGEGPRRGPPAAERSYIDGPPTGRRSTPIDRDEPPLPRRRPSPLDRSIQPRRPPYEIPYRDGSSPQRDLPSRERSRSDESPPRRGPAPRDRRYRGAPPRRGPPPHERRYRDRPPSRRDLPPRERPYRDGSPPRRDPPPRERPLREGSTPRRDLPPREILYRDGSPPRRGPLPRERPYRDGSSPRRDLPPRERPYRDGSPPRRGPPPRERPLREGSTPRRVLPPRERPYRDGSPPQRGPPPRERPLREGSTPRRVLPPRERPYRDGSPPQRGPPPRERPHREVSTPRRGPPRERRPPLRERPYREARLPRRDMSFPERIRRDGQPLDRRTPPSERPYREEIPPRRPIPQPDRTIRDEPVPRRGPLPPDGRSPRDGTPRQGRSPELHESSSVPVAATRAAERSSSETGRSSPSDERLRIGVVRARGGENGFPVHGGYCPGEICADGGVAAGVGNGTGSGTLTKFLERRRMGTNEDISAYKRDLSPTTATA